MLRNSLVSVLILLYSASAVGLPLHFHYCNGELKHITVLVKMECHPQQHGDAEHPCCQGNTAQCDFGVKTKDCCDDATEWIQDDLPALCAPGQKIKAPLVTSAVNVSTLEVVSTTTFGVEVPTSESESPSGPPIYLFQCSLLYYG